MILDAMLNAFMLMRLYSFRAILTMNLYTTAINNLNCPKVGRWAFCLCSGPQPDIMACHTIAPESSARTDALAAFLVKAGNIIITGSVQRPAAHVQAVLQFPLA